MKGFCISVILPSSDATEIFVFDEDYRRAGGPLCRERAEAPSDRHEIALTRTRERLIKKVRCSRKSLRALMKIAFPVPSRPGPFAPSPSTPVVLNSHYTAQRFSRRRRVVFDSVQIVEGR